MSGNFTDRQLEKAICQLQDFTFRRAGDLEREIGFGYRASECAPSDFDSLVLHYAGCGLTGLPYMVSSLHNETAPLGVEANLAFRFWHDCTHFRLHADFTHQGEVRVSERQIGEFEAEGVLAHSLPWKLLFAETFGQTECYRRLGEFPVDQTRFTLEYLEHGLPEAVARAGGRQGIQPIGDELAGVVRLRPSAGQSGGRQRSPSRSQRPRCSRRFGYSGEDWGDAA